MKDLASYLFFIIVGGLIALMFIPRSCTSDVWNAWGNYQIIDTVFVSDTLIKIDTLPLDIPKPSNVDTVRYDTLRTKPRKINKVINHTKANDSLFVDNKPTNDSLKLFRELVIPIVQKTYQTEQYKAIIEGYNPEIISMEVYPKTVYINNTQTITKYLKPKFAVTVGPSIGYGNKQFQVNYINVTFGWVLWSK